MAFCPFYVYRDCPQASECYMWTDFGCCLINKPGIMAIYTDGEEDPVDVYILDIKVTDADIQTDKLIIYALASTGAIYLETDLTKFAVHLL